MWASVTDEGPTITPAGTKRSPRVGRVMAGVGWTYILFCCDVEGGYCSVDTTHWPSVALVLGRRRMQRTGIESALALVSLVCWVIR